MTRFVKYSGHDWRASIEGRKTSDKTVVCLRCGQNTVIGKWPEKKCTIQYAPLEWLPLAEQSSAKIEFEA